MDDTMIQKRNGRRKAAEQSGKIEVKKLPPRGGKGGGKGKGRPFPGQAARS
jgi:hypothetical protein